MKIQKEIVRPHPDQSFKLFTPSLRHSFYWHYHPEYELVYVEATTGIRHVGRHISSFMNSDLVLIGSNIPHLNFDYGLQTEYRQIVVQFRENFMGDAFAQTPEFSAIQSLFDKAWKGLSFYGNTKAKAFEKMKSVPNQPAFQQLLSLLDILQLLAVSNEVAELNDEDTSIRLFMNDKIRMGSVYKYIHTHYNETPNVNKVAASVHLSTPAFCRYFKKQTNMTFTDFVNQYRVTHAKTLLLQDKTVSEVCYEVGFDSLSYFNKLFKKIAGENPSFFKKKYRQKLQ